MKNLYLVSAFCSVNNVILKKVYLMNHQKMNICSLVSELCFNLPMFQFFELYIII